MIQTIYLEVPFNRLSYLERPEFHQEGEKPFHDALKASMEKHGMRDPVYCWYNSKAYGSKIKIIVGNNRMVVAKELGLDPIRTIITNWKADEFPLEGKEFKVRYGIDGGKQAAKLIGHLTGPKFKNSDKRLPKRPISIASKPFSEDTVNLLLKKVAGRIVKNFKKITGHEIEVVEI